MKRSKKAHAVCLFSAALLAGLTWAGNCTIESSRIVLRSPYLPEAFSGTRIVQISDLHGRQFDANNAYLLHMVRCARPDLIAITGDLIDAYSEEAKMEPFLKELCEIAPVFFVTGNHECALRRSRWNAFEKLLSDCGVHNLSNDYCVLKKSGQSIVIAGVDDPIANQTQNVPRKLVQKIRALQGEDAFLLMLSHRNYELEQWSYLGVDAVLSGHAHGGIVRIPGIGGVFGTQRDLFPDYTAGLYKKGRTQLIVSRGLGVSRKLPVRINNTPELVTILLERENNA